MNRVGWMVGLSMGVALTLWISWRGLSGSGEKEGGEPAASRGSAGGAEEGEVAEARLIDEALRSLEVSGGRDETRRILDTLESGLFAMPADEASRAIAGFLSDDSRNIRTGLPFKLRADRGLEAAPTLRVALLDWLGRIDPPKSVELAEAILAESSDPDEWAICLRNKGLGDTGPEARDFLEAKAIELIRNPAWRAKPTAGYLEAFDVLVHTRATASVPILSRLVSDRSEEGRATAHAAFLTLDRLAQSAPAETLDRLARDSDLAATRPVMLAQIMARADLRDPGQRSVVEDYLLDPERSITGLDAFAAIYPNSNYPISDNLLTDVVIPSGAEMDQRDREARKVIERWMGEERFGAVRDQLESIRKRLDSQLAD